MIQATQERLSHALGLVLQGLLAILVLLSTVETVAWVGFDHSWAAAEEIQGILMVWLAVLGAAWGVDQGFHIAVDLLVGRLPQAWQGAIERLAALAVAAFGGCLAVFGAQLAMRVSNTLPATGWSAAVSYVPAAVGGALIALFALGGALAPRPAGTVTEDGT